MKDFPAAYQSTAGSALDVDKAFYRRIAEETAGRRLVDVLRHPDPHRPGLEGAGGSRLSHRRGRGPQVGDLNLWNLDNPRERLWASRTRQLQAAHVTVFDRLWSTLPYLRPMATITSDSLAGYGVDEYGGRIHDLLGTRCDPYVNRMLTGDDFDFCCHSNLVRAVAPHGLTELDVHDVLNVFQCTGLNRQDKYFMRESPARTGDHLEFFAEIDLLCALSTCPGGDLSVPLWGPMRATRWRSAGRSASRSTRSIEALLKDFKPPPVAAYKGAHGLRLPKAAWER